MNLLSIEFTHNTYLYYQFAFWLTFQDLINNEETWKMFLASQFLDRYGSDHNGTVEVKNKLVDKLLE